MAVSLVNFGIVVDEKQYKWGDISKIILTKSVGNFENFYLFNNSGTVMERFILDMSKPGNVDFLNQLDSAAIANEKKVLRVPDGMMMCPTCGNIVAKNALSCPECGHVFREQKSGGVGILGIAAAIVIAILILSAG